LLLFAMVRSLPFALKQLKSCARLIFSGFGILAFASADAQTSVRLAEFPRAATIDACRSMNEANVQIIAQLRQSRLRQFSQCTQVYSGLAASQCQRSLDPQQVQLDQMTSAAIRRNGECLRVARENEAAASREQQAYEDQRRTLQQQAYRERQQTQQRRQVELQASARIQAERAAQANASSAAAQREAEKSQMWQRAIDAVRAIANDGGNALAIAQSPRPGTVARVITERQTDEIRSDGAFAAGEAAANFGRQGIEADSDIEGSDGFDDAIESARTFSGVTNGRTRDTANQAAIGYYSRTVKNAANDADTGMDTILSEPLRSKVSHVAMPTPTMSIGNLSATSASNGRPQNSGKQIGPAELKKCEILKNPAKNAEYREQNFTAWSALWDFCGP
jgi:hypothetical protein